jgi:hypothetical protein
MHGRGKRGAGDMVGGRRTAAGAVLVWTLMSLMAPIGAEERILLQLNKLEDVSPNCRAYLFLENGTSAAFSSFTLDLVTFSKDGVISQRMAVELAPIGPKKNIVSLFDIPDTSCSEVVRMLLNGITSCQTATGDRQDCVDLVELSSLAKAEFFK